MRRKGTGIDPINLFNIEPVIRQKHKDYIHENQTKAFMLKRSIPRYKKGPSV